MKNILIALIISVGLVGIAVADAAAGKDKSTACVACHGEGGNSLLATFPKLAGQNANYLFKQMKNIQCGALSADEQKAQKCIARSVPTMIGQLDNFNDEDLTDIADYFASQTISGSQANADLVVKGEEIYRAGIRAKNVAACTACHSPTGQGNGPAGFPALGGQHADYVAAQLKAFRAAADGLPGRDNDGDIKIMRDIAYSLSDSEIDAVSSYISGLY
jgi:cytochrome c553